MKASGVKPQRVEWLWRPYVPAGKITAVAGQMGQAKSLFTCWLAAAATTGELGPPRSVVMYSAEDDPEDTIVPRLAAAEADLERIWLEPGVALDADRVAAICDEFGDVALVTVDPVQAYLPGGVNAWKGQDIRRHFDPIRRLAAERGIAVLLVQHLNRRGDAGDPLARIADSQGIPQLARSVLLWGPDPADPAGDQGSSKVLTRAKGNLSRSPASATYAITERTVSEGSRRRPCSGAQIVRSPPTMFSRTPSRDRRPRRPPSGCGFSSPMVRSRPRRSTNGHVGMGWPRGRSVAPRPERAR